SLLADDLLAIEAGLCTRKEEKKCKEECGKGQSDNWIKTWKWTHKECPKKRYRDLSDYTRFIIWLVNLQQAGFPFGQNLLELTTWEHMLQVKRILEPPQFCPFMRKKEDGI
ncbi:MAG: hypothetical protein GY749_02710, partial [Desulfobacteraceae bacterium]|nr:hypothetical protein [Desulfobacteraceae bacterium]